MIHLCYLKNQLDDNIFFFDLSVLIHSLNPSDNIVIFNEQSFKLFRQNMFSGDNCYVEDYDAFVENDNFQTSPHLDWEKIASQKIKNICIVNFDSISPSILQQIIITKSKKTEISGIANEYVPGVKDFHFKIQECKDMGMNSDNMSIYLCLKHSISPSVINDIIDSPRFQNKELHNREIDSVIDLKKLFK